MTGSSPTTDSAPAAAEYLRLALARLAEFELSVDPVNYALMYSYVAGKDLALNDRVDELTSQQKRWNQTTAQELFHRFICQCSPEDLKGLREELVMTVAQIIGSVIDMAGQASVSSALLEKHMQQLADSDEPREILSIAAGILSDTRKFVDQSRNFEHNLIESTQEISLLKDELNQARRMATTDALTGLNNRRGFDEKIIELIEYSKKDNDSFCLLILDIDHFKSVNDKHGHLVGDKVLKGIGRLLHQHMRGRDYLARFGGEEFAILLPDTPITGGFTVAENLRKSVERLRLKHVKTGTQLGQVTVSIGVGCYNESEIVIEFIQRCDKALYRAKTLGRNRTVLAD